jgi:MFS family permease
MVAYVIIAPIAGAFADRVPRRALLVGLDLIRLLVALALPFVTQAWQVYVLILLLQAASAAFTPTFQATIPDVLPEEDRYTRALSLSRLAYGLESILSPALAALALGFVSFSNLFYGTAFGFAASALLVVSVTIPSPKSLGKRGIYDRTTRGIRFYLATPRLRGLMGLNLTVAMAGAMVLVNTVVLVRADLGLGDEAVAWAMAIFGAGSISAALVLPRLLERVDDRPVMLGGACAMLAGLVVLGVGMALHGLSFALIACAWFVLGLGFSTVLTPSGRLLRRSAHAEDRPAIFAAQFALSHGCWLLAYPLAGWLMTHLGASGALIGLGGLALLGVIAALRVWPAREPGALAHSHDNLPPDHPHLRAHAGGSHSHEVIIDDLHQHWPARHS